MLRYWLWLSALPGLNNEARLTLLNHFGTPDKIFYAGKEELSQVRDLHSYQVSRVMNHDLSAADAIWEDCCRLDIGILTIQDAAYPTRLRNIFNPPCLLYIKGSLPVMDGEAAIAVVGTRSCTPYGLSCANRISREMAACGAVVVTGLAKGVDAAAARGALQGGGIVVGVVGNGLDVHYPWESRDLYEETASAGALLSEYPPGAEPERRNFPERNRIMSGLSAGVLVVEAPERSGALITAGLALDQGREVFAVPGPIDVPTSRGCNHLIREGAGLVMNGWDVLREYVDRYPEKLRYVETNPWTAPDSPQKKRPEKTESDGSPEEPEAPAPEKVLPVVHPSELDADQTAILRVLQTESPTQVDDLIQAAGIPAQQVLSALTMLEINGMVWQHSGKRYTRAVTLEE
ncbi:MAG: DNA-protecting protein DprA [Oscillibacter sp.]|nr:DNA-protecting protein DprA [Oscillibacter sp.]